MSTFVLLTKGGVADPEQEQKLLDLAAELSKPNAKLLLHLHGGLIDETSGLAIAKRLSGATTNSWNLGADWTQVYVVWRTGALETIKTNWMDLVHDDRLYQAIVRKLIGFVARRLGIPSVATRGPGTLVLSDADIQRRLSGNAGPRPFDDLDDLLAPELPTGSRAAIMTELSSGELAIEFQKDLADDREFQDATADIDESVNVPSGARAPALGADQANGAKMRSRLDEHIREQLAPPPAEAGQARGIVSTGIFLLNHAGKVAVRCFKRFRSGRDHGLHATIVEEVCREFYGDLVGAKIWGMMVKDAADHFVPGNLGTALIDIIKSNPPKDFAIVGHSAGSIWASRFLLAAKEAGFDQKVKLFLLAPAVRETLFAEMLDQASDLIACCRMITMTDAFERKDAVLGHDKGYVYPSSLLYLVSGMFEERDAKAYPDAPIVGMQRYAGLAGLDTVEAEAARKVAAFFQRPDHGIISSPTAGVSMCDTHGGFDYEPLTLATARALF